MNLFFVFGTVRTLSPDGGSLKELIFHPHLQKSGGIQTEQINRIPPLFAAIFMLSDLIFSALAFTRLLFCLIPALRILPAAISIVKTR